MRKVVLGIPLAVILALGLGLSIGTRARSAEDMQHATSQKHEVNIDNFTFGPQALTVSLGATVTWINKDDVPHTVVSTDGKGIKSPVLDTDEKFSYTFTKSGSYAYFCSVHPRMTGKIVVQ